MRIHQDAIIKIDSQITGPCPVSDNFDAQEFKIPVIHAYGLANPVHVGFARSPAIIAIRAAASLEKLVNAVGVGVHGQPLGSGLNGLELCDAASFSPTDGTR